MCLAHPSFLSNIIDCDSLHGCCVRPSAHDDGSFILKHAKLNMVAVPKSGGEFGVGNGELLVWRNCMSDCKDEFTLDEFHNLGFVFENYEGDVCLPIGV